MSDPVFSITHPENRLLAALPLADYQRLLPYLEPVALQLTECLYQQAETVTHVYFPTTAMISLVTVLDHRKIEVGVVGREGMVSTAVFMDDGISPYETMAQVAGDAVRIKASILKEAFHQGGALQQILLRYAQALYLQVSQTAACNQLHSLDERLARWLLMTHDRVQRNTLPLKQEFLSMMLGVERSRVTLAAISLQDAGIIKYSRGNITILSRSDLETVACQCYGIVYKAMEALLPR
jgi:CRP-like cAMP-binding protein